MAEAAKTKADGLFRDRKYTDAIDSYTEAIEADSAPNKACFSNRAACREKLIGNTYGDEKTKLIEAGLADARKCVELDAQWARGYQRLAAFTALAVSNEAAMASRNDDYVVGPRHGDDFDDRDDAADFRRSAKAAKNAAVLRSECEKACRAGLALDPGNEALRLNLQTLRDASDYSLDPSLEPTDDTLVDKETAATHKKAGSAAFGAKDMKTAEKAFTRAIAYDNTDHVFYSNRSACRVTENDYRGALADARACVRLKPDWAKGHNRLATALYGRGEYIAAEAACDAGLALEPQNAGLVELKKTCAIETAEPLAVQQQMAKFRAEKRSNKKMNDLLKGLNFGGAGGPQVFSPNQFSGMMGGGGGLGGLGGGGANMTEAQMRQMARAMANPDNAIPVPPTPPPDTNNQASV